MEERSADNLRAAIRAHQERMLIERGRFYLGVTIAGVLVLWVLGVSHLLERAGSPLPLLNTIELCILMVVATQVHRQWFRQHMIALSTAVCVQLAAFVALYGLWTGNLWLFSLRMITLNLLTAAVLPWGIGAQAVIMVTSTLAFALVHWTLNGTLDHPSTFPTLVVFLFSVPMASFLAQAHAKLATEMERRQTAENALRRAAEIARVSVWTSDLRTLTIHFSSGWKSLVGRDESESTLAEWWDLVHPDDRAKATAAVQAHLQNRTSLFETEQRMLHADGSYRWVLTRGSIVYDSEGQPCGQCGADIDITERKQMEATLQEARTWLQLATESAKVALWTCDLRTHTIRFSSGRKRVLGRDDNEIPVAEQWDLVHPDDRTQAIATLQEHFRTGTSPYENERRVLHADGSYRCVLVRSTTAYDSEGQPCVQYGADIDITERKQLEEALRGSEEKYRQLVEDIGEVIYAVDANDIVTYVSPAVESLYGYAPAEIVNRPYTDFVPAEDVPGLAQGFAETPSGSQDLRVHRIVTKAGDVRWVRNSARGVAEPGGVGLRGVLMDVTERRRIEHELQALTKELDARVIERTRQLSEALEQRKQAERALEAAHNALEVQVVERTVAGDILQALNAHLNLADACPAVGAGLQRLTGCSFSGLSLFDDGSEWITYVGLSPGPVPGEPNQRWRLTDVPAPDIRAGRTRLIPDLAVERDWPAAEFLYAQGFRSGLSLPLRGSDGIAGMLTLVWREPGGPNAAQLPLLEQIADAVALAVEKTRLFEQVDAGRDRLKVLSRRLIEIQETERAHFARELHDEIGQMLTGLQFLLQGLPGLPPAAAKRMAEAEELVNDLCGQVRDLSLELRPAMLDDLGLLPALLWLFGRYTKQTGITVGFEHQGLKQRFPAEQETAAYRIVQEGLTNVARHARVSTVSVHAWVEDGLLGVRIADEGIGFDAEKALAAGRSGGLAGMRERALLVGGTLKITSVPGRRTEVRVYIPTARATWGRAAPRGWGSASQ